MYITPFALFRKSASRDRQIDNVSDCGTQDMITLLGEPKLTTVNLYLSRSAHVPLARSI